MSDDKQTNIIKANRMLQAKVGAGPLDTQKVERAQTVMDNNDVDFSPLGMEILAKLSDAIQKAKSGDLEIKEAKQAMTEPVMQLKANAATFRYSLIGNLANIMLSFLESVREMDDAAIQIVEAHHKTLTAIVMKKMQGDGGPAGAQMEQELKGACARYFKSKKKKA